MAIVIDVILCAVIVCLCVLAVKAYLKQRKEEPVVEEVATASAE